MLKGLPKVISPELLKCLDEMGHGDELVIADGNFPSGTNGIRVVRADGISGPEMLKAIMALIPLDTYSNENFLLMETVKGDPTPTIWKEYDAIGKQDPAYRPGHIERQAFYERSKKAYVIIATGEQAVYANIILKKGVIK
jgi:L-fucose mutarotase